MMLFPFFVCWGSFLNVVAYRLLHNENIVWPRSACPHCKTEIAWYDLIPVISWLMLRGKCRTCHQPISILYPLIELFTGVLFTAAYILISHQFLIAYYIFFSALIVTIRSDLETMLISRFVTLFLIPLGLLFSFFNALPISTLDSLLGALFGYLSLYIVAQIFWWCTKKEGIGEGDFELLAFIGSFTGLYGCWMSLTIGSIIGSILGLLYMIITKSDRSLKIPFGPFLALGAITSVLLQTSLASSIWHLY
ncbi:MAG TPA: prepilin peptidase [Candidatus Babeliales bacterium]|nr:prepilin peptidase [Candidatus Babeliales bacterium]